MKHFAFFVLLAILSLAFWGCPSKKYIPDPTPPQPQVQWLEDTPGYLGREPYVGPKIQFERMIANRLMKKAHLLLCRVSSSTSTCLEHAYVADGSLRLASEPF